MIHPAVSGREQESQRPPGDPARSSGGEDLRRHATEHGGVRDPEDAQAAERPILPVHPSPDRHEFPAGVAPRTDANDRPLILLRHEKRRTMPGRTGRSGRTASIRWSHEAVRRAAMARRGFGPEPEAEGGPPPIAPIPSATSVHPMTRAAMERTRFIKLIRKVSFTKRPPAAASRCGARSLAAVPRSCSARCDHGPQPIMAGFIVAIDAALGVEGRARRWAAQREDPSKANILPAGGEGMPATPAITVTGVFPGSEIGSRFPSVGPGPNKGPGPYLHFVRWERHGLYPRRWNPRGQPMIIRKTGRCKSQGQLVRSHIRRAVESPLAGTVLRP